MICQYCKFSNGEIFQSEFLGHLCKECSCNFLDKRSKLFLQKLSHFNGSENIYNHYLNKLKFTDGIKYLAEQLNCFWLIDLVASYQHELLNNSFQLWSIRLKSDKGAIIECREDTNLPPLVTQVLEYTDFPLNNFEFYVVGGTMLLKSEY